MPLVDQLVEACDGARFAEDLAGLVSDGAAIAPLELAVGSMVSWVRGEAMQAKGRAGRRACRRPGSSSTLSRPMSRGTFSGSVSTKWRSIAGEGASPRGQSLARRCRRQSPAAAATSSSESIVGSMPGSAAIPERSLRRQATASFFSGGLVGDDAALTQASQPGAHDFAFVMVSSVVKVLDAMVVRGPGPSWSHASVKCGR